MISGQFLKPIDAEDFQLDPGVQAYLADYQAVRPRFDKGDTIGQVGYVTGEALVHVPRSMKHMSRAGMMEAARNFDRVPLGLLLPGIGLSTKSGSDGYPIESMQLFQFDGETYRPIDAIVSYEGRTPKS